MKDLVFPFAIATGFAMMGVDTAVTVLPRAALDDFFAVQSVIATRQGDTAILEVHRQILHPIHMGFNVRIQSLGEKGWHETCAMQAGPILYQPDAALPEPVTLDWWTWGECPTLPEGKARIVTTWIPEPKGMESVTVVSEVK